MLTNDIVSFEQPGPGWLNGFVTNNKNKQIKNKMLFHSKLHIAVSPGKLLMSSNTGLAQ